VRPQSLRITGLVATLGAFGACSAPARRGTLEVHGAYAFAPITTEEAAVYFTVVNHGNTPDTLVGATCGCARSAALHQESKRGMTGMGGMVMERNVPIAPGDSLDLMPGGTHLMLDSLDHLPKAGERISVTLRFAHTGTVVLEVPVRPYAQ